jgi:hypothetical protein
MSFGQVLIEREGLSRSFFRFVAAFNRRNVTEHSESRIGLT